jgi:hypothetical protein
MGPFCRLAGWKGGSKTSPIWVTYAGSAITTEVCVDHRRMFGGSAALEGRERLQTTSNEEELPHILRELITFTFKVDTTVVL